MRKPESPIAAFDLERHFARYEFNAPYLLCASDIQGYPMRALLALASEETRALWDDLALGYTETLGHPRLRSEIAGLYEQVEPEHILCFAGAEEAIYIAMRVILRPGDHLITTFPGYQSSYQVAETIGAEVSHWELRPQTRTNGQKHWYADPADLRRLIRPDTRIILVNFPHNPTGALPSHEEWQEILAVAREAGCYLFSDEVYRLLEYNPDDRLPAAVDQYDRGLSLGVMSKPFGLAGLRVGWLALRDAGLMRALASYKDYTTICNSAPSEILSIIALQARQQVLARSMQLIRANLSRAEAAMKACSDAFEWLPPRAGSIAFPRWTGPGSVDSFTEALVAVEGVLLLPGTVYSHSGNHFRLGLGRENAPEALERLVRFVKAYTSASSHMA